MKKLFSYAFTLFIGSIFGATAMYKLIAWLFSEYDKASHPKNYPPNFTYTKSPKRDYNDWRYKA